MNWHSMSIEEVLTKTGSKPGGLDDAAVQQKTEEYGKNELISKKKISPLVIFLRQFLDVMILVLGVAAVISVFIGEVSDTIVIVVIIVLNAVIGFIQEYRAEQAMEALKKMAAPSSNVTRNGKNIEVPTADLVPGDIVLLEAGNSVPADIRLSENESLKTNEASLTGESNPIDKKTNSANHNDRPLDELLKSFRRIRTKTVSSLETLDETIIFKSALHPRLKTPMRTMDLFLFVAEHDDHHLARITELARILNKNN